MTTAQTTWPTGLDTASLTAWMNERFGATMMEHIRMRLVEMSPERAVSEMPVHDGVRSLVGPVHTGAMVTLADTTATCLSLLAVNKGGEPERFAVAINLTSQIVGNVTEGTLRAESVFTHPGRTIMAVQTRVTSVETGRLLALVNTTHYVR